MKTNWEIQEEIENQFQKYCKLLNLDDEEIRLWMEADVEGNWGQAGSRSGEFYIRVSLKMLARQPEEIEETVAHELAHIRCFKDNIREPHGPEFKLEMLKMGFSGMISKKFDRGAAPVWARAI